VGRLGAVDLAAGPHWEAVSFLVLLIVRNGCCLYRDYALDFDLQKEDGKKMKRYFPSLFHEWTMINILQPIY